MKVAIADIQVGERRREKMGDMRRFAKSLERYGLIHPIVIDDQRRLVAGGRRLLAAAMLGWTHIEARSMGELSEEERRAIELEENRQRKDLTPAEKSKKLVAQGQDAEEILRQRAEAPPEPATDESPVTPTPGGFLGEVPKNLGGRPPDPASETKVAEVLGVDQKTLNNAKHHVAAIERYPVLGGPEVSQKQALELADVLDKLPSGEAAVMLAILKGMDLPWRKVAEALPRVAAMPPERRQTIYRLAEGETQRERSRAITLVADTGPSPDPQLSYVQAMGELLKQATACASRCTRDYPHDPWTDELRAMVTSLRTMGARLIGIEQDIKEATRRAYDAVSNLT